MELWDIYDINRRKTGKIICFLYYITKIVALSLMGNMNKSELNKIILKIKQIAKEVS